MIDEATAILASFLVGLAIGCGVGGCCGYQYAADRERSKAIEARVGRWEADASTGQTTFVYGNPKPATPEGAPSQP